MTAIEPETVEEPLVLGCSGMAGPVAEKAAQAAEAAVYGTGGARDGETVQLH